MSKERDTSLILNKIKEYYNFKTNSEFASFLGISPQALSSWYSRNSIDYNLVYSKCVDIDANWLLTGEGEMLKKEKETDLESKGKNEASVNLDDELMIIARNLSESIQKQSEVSATRAQADIINAEAHKQNSDNVKELIDMVKSRLK